MRRMAITDPSSEDYDRIRRQKAVVKGLQSDINHIEADFLDVRLAARGMNLYIEELNKIFNEAVGEERIPVPTPFVYDDVEDCEGYYYCGLPPIEELAAGWRALFSLAAGVIDRLLGGSHGNGNTGGTPPAGPKTPTRFMAESTALLLQQRHPLRPCRALLESVFPVRRRLLLWVPLNCLRQLLWADLYLPHRRWERGLE